MTAQELSLQHISNILWAFVSFMQLSGPMVGAFLEELRSRLRHFTFNAQQLSNLLWSLCIAEVAPCTSLSKRPLARLSPWQAAENLLCSMQLWRSHDLFLLKCCSEGKETSSCLSAVVRARRGRRLGMYKGCRCGAH